MQGFGAEAGIAGDSVPDSEAAGSIPRQQIWDVVNYVRSLQYEPLSKGPHEREGPQMNLR